MTQDDFVWASLKLIGAVCLIVGFDLAATAVASVAAVGFGNGMFGIGDLWFIVVLTRPLAYFAAAYGLILKTPWCARALRFSAAPAQDPPTGLPNS